MVRVLQRGNAAEARTTRCRDEAALGAFEVPASVLFTRVLGLLQRIHRLQSQSSCRPTLLGGGSGLAQRIGNRRALYADESRVMRHTDDATKPAGAAVNSPPTIDPSTQERIGYGARCMRA
jgi:hypothetical protein